MSSSHRTFNLADILSLVAEIHPHRCAFVCGSQTLSFSELDERSTRLASSLRRMGVARGQHVGLQLFNSAAYLEAFFACCKIGAVPVNINYRYVADELVRLFRSMDLEVLFYSASFGQEVTAVQPQVPALKTLIQVGAGAGPEAALDHETLIASGKNDLHDVARREDDLIMLCTGGTTGAPRGVMWPHKSLFMGALGGGGLYFRKGPASSLDELAQWLKAAPEARYFALAPMMHGAALWATLISLYAAQTVVVNDQTHFDPEHVWQVTQDQRVNVISGVGDAMALPLVQALEKHPGRWNLQHLALYGNGGAPLSAQVTQRMKAAVPHLMFNNGMGSSEAGFMGGGEKPAEGDGLLVLPARPDLALFDAQRNKLTEPGSQGILGRTGHTPIGYYADPVKSAETFVHIEGQVWVMTGDIARINEQGRFVLLGRGSLCINSGGEKIFSEEVEEVIRLYSAVQDVLVVGVPDERWGQRVGAILELVPGCEFSPQEFERICRAHLAGYKMPRAVYLTDKVMRSPAGKADYRWAQALAQTSVSLI